MKKFDKHDYRNILDGGTKLSIDPTIEIKFDESTKFNQKELMKMTEEEFIITSLDTCD